MVMVDHMLQGVGTLAEHVEQLLGVQITDEALVDRRQRLPRVLQCLHKAATRRAMAAFAKLRLCVLVELRLHNPQVAVIGTEGESELTQARRLLAQLPPRCRLLIDRLYGVPSFLCDFLQQCLTRQSEFLARMRQGIKVRLLQRLPDGSSLLEVRVRDARDDWQTLQVRRGAARSCGSAS